MTTTSHAGEFDAVVVGGGLAGLAATHRLAANGLSVALAEKREVFVFFEDKQTVTVHVVGGGRPV